MVKQYDTTRKPHLMFTLILFAALLLVFMETSLTFSTISLYKAADRIEDLPARAKKLHALQSKLHHS